MDIKCVKCKAFWSKLTLNHLGECIYCATKCPGKHTVMEYRDPSFSCSCVIADSQCTNCAGTGEVSGNPCSVCEYSGIAYYPNADGSYPIYTDEWLNSNDTSQQAWQCEILGNHAWVEYIGLTERYKYCEECDIKESEYLEQVRDMWNRK